ncbi:hypothetical protein N7U66_01450 [Lacinutrix neustonica]|uniref:Uncharacterized protein n=1 Tax=Lacinutrix neustonica TaxID=2980107 RepID=A0A9E8MY51_9FLAO|nr:hypothetical protein [Lacinutrix neustonica]WAC02414.1 hypothetical protein N7U66_01450 [Lacinutrix neustonica]
MKTKNKNNYNSDITKDDLDALGARKEHIRSDEGDDQQLEEREKPVDFTGKDLDIPGRDLPKAKKPGALKDEENQLYSQGGDGNENLERDTNHLK